MMTFDYGGDGEPRGNAQLGLHHHPRVVHPPLKRRPGKLCCFSARPLDLADMISARPEVACVPMSYVSCVYSKRAALTRALVSFFTSERFVPFFYRTTRGTTPAHFYGLSSPATRSHTTKPIVRTIPQRVTTKPIVRMTPLILTPLSPLLHG